MQFSLKFFNKNLKGLISLFLNLLYSLSSAGTIVVIVAYASFVCIKFVVNPNAIIKRYHHILKDKGKYFKKLIRDFKEVKNKPQDSISLKSRLCIIIS